MHKPIHGFYHLDCCGTIQLGMNKRICKKHDTFLRTVKGIVISMMAISISGCSIFGSNPVQETTEITNTSITLSTMETTTVPVETEPPVETIPPRVTITMDFVNLIYTEIVGREANEQELDQWTTAINEDNSIVNDMIIDLLSSDEFMSRELSDEEYVSLCYRLFMRTIPDTELLTYWLDILTNEVSRIDIACEFMGSQEFREFCSGYGILPDNDGIASDNLSPRELVENIVAGENITGIGGYIPSEAVIAELNECIDTIRYRVGFILIDMQSGQGVCYNPDGDFYTASSIKGPFAVSLAAYNPEAALARENTIVSMLVYSDNDAYTALNDSYRRVYIQQWCEECGVDPAICVYKYPHMRPRDLALMWIHSYYFFEENELGPTVGAWFETPYYSLINSELGSMYVTRSKAGWVADDNPNHTTTVDAGIVYADNGDYVVVIMSTIPSSIEPLRPLMQALNNAHLEM